MASTLPTSDEQEPLFFEDLDVYFSQEECVSLYPAQKTLSREAPLESFEDLDLIGEDQTETSQKLSLEPVELEKLSLEKYSIAAPLVHCSEQSEEDVEIQESKMSGGTLTCKTKLISLLVTIDNQTPLVELSQCLGVKTLSDIIEVPWEEAKNVYKCPDCDQSFSDNTYLVLHQKIHSREKKYKCNTCEKTFSHRTNLRTHKRIHTGEKPYKCTKCAASFRQQSHLSRHMNSHLKEKPYTCSICGKSFMWLPGLAEHQKNHTDKKSYECADHDQETNLSLPEEGGSSDTPSQHTQCVQTVEQPSDPTLPEKDHKEDSKLCSIDDEDFFSFSRFKPLQCLDCDMTFPCFSELVSHQTIHDLEKPYKCKTCTKTFATESELASHEKSHRREEPFKCTVCGKSFRVNMQLITHKRTHRRNSKCADGEPHVQRHQPCKQLSS
ncbi:zinc finger protein 597 isoform X2 [Mastomys coucha]|uniref:zinc finger protein 597 isoform X2 n=1 Tax=Mastomys coucha TaxID=35658 RepID=UPI001261B4D3|nr:zinc finger protein 597 isoform X2 [Mastomys coucha]